MKKIWVVTGLEYKIKKLYEKSKNAQEEEILKKKWNLKTTLNTSLFCWLVGGREGALQESLGNHWALKQRGKNENFDLVLFLIVGLWNAPNKVSTAICWIIHCTGSQVEKKKDEESFVLHIWMKKTKTNRCFIITIDSAVHGQTEPFTATYLTVRIVVTMRYVQ